FRAEAWYDAGLSYDVSIVTPAGQLVGPVARGANISVQTSSGIVEIANGQATSANGASKVDLFVYRGNTSYPQVATGTWSYRFHAQSGGTHRVDCWTTSFVLGAARPVFVRGMTESRLVMSPASANGVIAVGAYATKRTWTAADGNTYGYS